MISLPITDSWGGNPHLERCDSWDGGFSYMTKSARSLKTLVATYTLVIRSFTEKFDDTFFMPNPGKYRGGGMPGDVSGMMAERYGVRTVIWVRI